MNMENFISGFSGHERQHRAALLKVLGKEKYEVFFDSVSNTSFHITPRKHHKLIKPQNSSSTTSSPVQMLTTSPPSA